MPEDRVPPPQDVAPSEDYKVTAKLFIDMSQSLWGSGWAGKLAMKHIMTRDRITALLSHGAVPTNEEITTLCDAGRAIARSIAVAATKLEARRKRGPIEDSK